MERLDPFVCATFLFAAFTLAGAAHALWLRSRWSRTFQIPLDCGRTFAGRRIFGDNKTWRGLMVMIPATGAAFALLAGLRPLAPGAWSRGLWPLDQMTYCWLGLWAGMGFMVGELPNSFLKRRLDVGPGLAPSHPGLRLMCLILDRIDSIAGAFVALVLFIPIPWQTIVCVMLLGPGLHFGFSVLLFRLGVKGRAA
jgi:CDP-archaeol synthase